MELRTGHGRAGDDGLAGRARRRADRAHRGGARPLSAEGGRAGGDALGALEAVAEAALGLARSTTSGRLALAAIADVVPSGLAPRPLQAVLDEAAAAPREPLRPRVVEGVLRAAWGVAPTDELSALDLEPAAVTPTAQVHRGVLDGQDVAVKVQRPGLPEQVRADLTTLGALVRPLQLALPRLEAGALLAEVRERALDELDLEHEASAQRRLSRALRGVPDLLVPAPVGRLSHPTVLVSAWAEGVPVGTLAGAPVAEREAAARALVRLHVGSARVGLVHADPHPAHALRTTDGRFAFVDLGGTRTVAAARVDLAVAAVDALADEDGAALGETLGALGWLPADEGGRALALAWDLVGDLLAGPAVLDVAALLAARGRLQARVRDVVALAVRGRVPPEDVLPLRMLGQLALVLAPLAVELDWIAIVRSAAAHGPEGDTEADGARA